MEINERNVKQNTDGQPTAADQTVVGTPAEGAVLPDSDQQAIQALASLEAAATTAQQEFDGLVTRKEDLWSQINDKELYDLTEEWKEIQSLDERLLKIWNSGTVTRKEDK